MSEGRPRVLVVDDDPLTATAIARPLLRQYEVTLASGGAEALRLVRDGHAFDLVLCDLMMPGIHGVAVLESLQRESPAQAARFVFLTARVRSAQEDFDLGRFAVRVLHKPISAAALREAVATTLAELARREP